MWVVVRNALAARRGQAVVVAVVALLASVAVSAAPWYAVAARQRVGVAEVAAAPVTDRLISIGRPAEWVGPGSSSGSERAMATARREFAPAGFTRINGGSVGAQIRRADPGKAPVDAEVAYRDDLCDHVVVTGSCPSAAGEVAVPASLVDELGVRVGNRVRMTALGEKPLAARIVGVYRVIEPSEPYWGSGDLVGLDENAGSGQQTVFTVHGTVRGQDQVAYTYDLIAQPQAFASVDTPRLAADIELGMTRLQGQGFSISDTGLDGLLDRIEQERRNVTAGVAVGVVVLLLLTWFVLIVVVREAAVQVRADVGWWRLRGAPSGRGWVVVLGQSVVPLVCGAVIGVGAGIGVGRGLGGDIVGGADRTALLLSLVAAGLAVAGGLVAVVIAQLGTLLTPVRDLLRRIPVRRGGWRRSMVDLMLVGLAAYGVVQALVLQQDIEGLPLLAPALAALAIALVAAWAVSPLAARLALRARHSGRLAVALIAGLIARRPDTHRLFALAVVAVALVTTGFVSWDTTAQTQSQRAMLEGGADRVITVDAADPAQLLAGVRAADPSGTAAMAVIDQPELSSDPPMLAMDTTRLSVIAGWRREYGGDVGQVAAALRPEPPHPVVVRTGRLELRAAGTSPAGTPVHLRIRLRTQLTGEPVDAIIGPLTTSRDTYAAAVPACADGCRLVGVQVLGNKQRRAIATYPADPEAVGYRSPQAGTRVELYPGGDSDAAGLPAALLSAPVRWRPAVGPLDLGPAISAGDDGIRITELPTPDDVLLNQSDWAFVADTPAPLPVVAAGWQPDPAEEARLAPLPGAAVPLDVVGTASLVPRYGATGVLADLEYAERLVPFAIDGGTPQVWLSADAPASILADLQKAGLTPLREDKLSDRIDWLRSEGSAVGVRFQAVVALIGLLLTAGAVLTNAARERPGRAAELGALRTQGLRAPIVATVGYLGLGGMLAAAAVVGLLAGLVGAGIARVLYPGFVDGWSVLATAPPRAYPVGVAAAAAVVVFGAVVIATGAALVRRTRGGPG